MPTTMAELAEELRSPDTGLPPSAGAVTNEPPPIWCYRVNYTDGSFELIDSVERLTSERLIPELVGQHHLVYTPAWLTFRIPDGRVHFVRTHAVRSILEIGQKQRDEAGV